MPPHADSTLDHLWALANGTPSERPPVSIIGRERALPSTFEVTAASTALVGATLAAVAELAGQPTSITVDTDHTAVAFRSERFLALESDQPSLWDPLAGHYESSDGHIQFHTNFAHHRTALLDALELPHDSTRDQVAAIVRRSTRDTVESAVGDAGGIAAAVRTLDEWRAHPQFDATAGGEPLVSTSLGGETRPARSITPRRPLEGVRVLDLTRVIAGPVCTRTLAAYGADVLRVGADDLPVIDGALPDTTLGKRFTHIDLKTETGRDRLFALARDADVIVTGFRPDALADAGVTRDALLDANPSLIVAELSAFGTTGPWGGRRGFDSITQSATGVVAEETAGFDSDKLRPLPCQLLDHGSGFLLALGVVRALTDQQHGAAAQLITVSLLGTRHWLESLGRCDAEEIEAILEDPAGNYTAERSTIHGTIRHATHPGTIAAVPAIWDIGPARPGQHQPEWIPR